MSKVFLNNWAGSLTERPARVPRRYVLTALATGFASASLLASTQDARAQGAGVDAAARAMLPETLRKSGVLHAGMEIDYAPYMYQVDSKAEGMDPDLIRAICAKLGLKAEFRFVDFSAILPGVQSGRFDIGANFANTAARRKAVSFINYLGFANGLLVLKSNPHKLNVNDVDSICGLRIAAGVGSFAYFDTTKRSELCVKDKKPPITIVPMSPTNAVNALRAGRVDGAEDDAIVVIYVAGQPAGHDLEAVTLPNVLHAPTLGYITDKDANGVALARAMAAAVNAMIKDGEYATILKKWKVPKEMFLAHAFAN